ncbi:MAG: putative sugar nucleotidyl transferase [Bacteroidetes bacterium]|nr:putative sugar nucleotidyl transferase [Rhodothermia bacterium]MCX7907660.1 putative sugar nucleotidyl transferase [Bacteroidota bacterium]MDW8286360.1 putative sugar nucleotidyl transferase [Bacteroidota bacterium]
MTQIVYLVEDAQVARLLPLVWTRPVFELRVGVRTLWEKHRRLWGGGVELRAWVRPFLAPWTEQAYDIAANRWRPADVIFWVNARWIPTETQVRAMRDARGPQSWWSGSQWLALRLEGEALLRWDPEQGDPNKASEGWPRTDWEGVRLLRRLGDVVYESAAELTRELSDFPLGRFEGRMHAGALGLTPERIYLAPGSVVYPGAVLNAESGPIVVDEGAEVGELAAIRGPCYIGPHTQVRMGARLYGGTSIGPVCRVGGEVVMTTFQGYANKAHDGHLGHAWIGAWVNLGAGTQSSNLKNDYRPVRIWDALEGRFVDTDRQFLGLFAADHVKSAVGTTFNTGTVVGVGANVFGAGFPRTLIPSFSWGGAAGFSTYPLDRFLAAAERVLARRNRSLSEADRELLRYVYEATRPERTWES